MQTTAVREARRLEIDRYPDLVHESLKVQA